MPTLRVRAGVRFQLDAPQETPAVFIVRPETNAFQAILEEHWECMPPRDYHDYVDIYGNECRRVTLPAGEFAVRYDALVELDAKPDDSAPQAAEVPIAALPDDALVYTLPSRYCLSDVLAPKAAELFGGMRADWSRVQAICDFVNGHVKFTHGSSTPETDAVDVFESGTGVCRDYAHLAISFCRALNIPARYAFGYLPDIDVEPPYPPMDFAAWFEVYLGDRWFIFDPRNNERRRGRITIARGRDALDVAMLTTYGQTSLIEMAVVADRVEDHAATL